MRQAVIRIFQRNVCVRRHGVMLSNRPNPTNRPPLCPNVRQMQTSSINLVSREDSHNKKSASRDDEDDIDEEKTEEMRQRARKNALTTSSYFNSKERNKETFEVMLDMFTENNPHRRGVVEFINAAAKHMEDYSVAYDIATYKKLINLMPEGKYVPRNVLEQDFYHYPKQQDCIVNLLDSMELKGTLCFSEHHMI